MAVRGWDVSLRIGSLFSGIGGLELGLERAGLGPTVWQVENDDYCQRVLSKHWPDAARYGDVRGVDWSQVDAVDVVCAGFPCQPFSSAGKRTGVADERWMWPEVERCLRVVRPRWVVLENVPALLRDADAFGLVLADLAAHGFDAEWSVLSACAVGAPHVRERLFVVAHADCGDGSARLGVGDARPRPLPGRDDHACAWRDRVNGSLEAAGGDGREVDGVPRWMVSALGNAVVPQVAEFVGRRILEADRREVAA